VEPGVKPQTAPLRPVVFLDRDGTMIEDADYLADPAGVRVLPGVPDALRRLRAAVRELVVISNQSGIARGLLTELDARRVNAEVDARLRAEGVDILDWLYCPHLDGPVATVDAYRSACACRKPKPGMLEEAARRHGLDLAGCVVVGDKLDDVNAAKAVGGRGVLVLTGKGREFVAKGRPPEAAAVVEGLKEAADWILSSSPKPR
jgi:D-glycero-D-manno-heptose 1,7-bisphosphate phosphatase